jgi:hypothetical protein
VLGNQITKSAVWAWSAFAAVLLFGALVTGWAAYRAAMSDDSAQHSKGMTHIDTVTSRWATSRLVVAARQQVSTTVL